MSTAETKAIKAELKRLLAPKPRVNKRISGRGKRLADAYLEIAPLVQCADGFTMSVQASKHHYCTPRDSAGPWTKVEVGFPTTKVESFMPYIDGADSDPTDTVYGYVPIRLVVQAIADHGGFKAVAA